MKRNAGREKVRIMNGFEQLERLQLMITPQHFAKLGNNPLVFFFFLYLSPLPEVSAWSQGTAG